MSSNPLQQGANSGLDDGQPHPPSEHGLDIESESELLDPAVLLPPEIAWRNRQKWLEQAGYMLRPRYRVGWRPSWEGTSRSYVKCEDGHSITNASVIDATRISDGTLVTLKAVVKAVHPYELEIGLFLTSESLSSDPRNHCVPIIEVLEPPGEEDKSIIVMPFLLSYDSPRFDTFGEVAAYFKQVFEGLQFIHAQNVAHRDCDGRNIMMDAASLYPEGFSPIFPFMKPDMSGLAKHYTRTHYPVKYYFIDFGISRRYNPEDGPPREIPIMGGDRSVPEFQNWVEPLDPFPTDIYYLGNMIRTDFIETKRGFEFMEGLVSDMVQDEPSKRPTIDEVVTRFEAILKSLSGWKLRSRVPERDDLAIFELYRTVIHWKNRIGHVIRRRPAVPIP